MGRVYYEDTGKVETWMGICYGRAPASYMIACPEQSIEVLALDRKTKINFYLSDVKALGSLLWANSLQKIALLAQGAQKKLLKQIKTEES